MADFDRDGDLDIVNGQNWHANLGGKGLVLEKRPVIPFPLADLKEPGEGVNRRAGRVLCPTRRKLIAELGLD